MTRKTYECCTYSSQYILYNQVQNATTQIMFSICIRIVAIMYYQNIYYNIHTTFAANNIHGFKISRFFIVITVNHHDANSLTVLARHCL